MTQYEYYKLQGKLELARERARDAKFGNSKKYWANRVEELEKELGEYEDLYPTKTRAEKYSEAKKRYENLTKRRNVAKHVATKDRLDRELARQEAIMRENVTPLQRITSGFKWDEAYFPPIKNGDQLSIEVDLNLDGTPIKKYRTTHYAEQDAQATLMMNQLMSNFYDSIPDGYNVTQIQDEIVLTPKENKVSARKEIERQLAALSSQLTALREAADRYSILPDEDPYEDEQIIRFRTDLKLRKPVTNEYGQPAFEDEIVNITFVALRAGGNWYVTGNRFFGSESYTWDELVDTLLDSELKLVVFEFLNINNDWERIYPVAIA